MNERKGKMKDGEKVLMPREVRRNRSTLLIRGKGKEEGSREWLENVWEEG